MIWPQRKPRYARRSTSTRRWRAATSWRTARAQSSLAWDLILRDNAQDGEPMLMAAGDRLIATVGRTHVATQWASARLAEYFKGHHRDAEAAQVLADAR